MMRKRVFQRMEFPEGQDGTISPMIGCVQIAVLAKKILKCMKYKSLAAD